MISILFLTETYEILFGGLRGCALFSKPKLSELKLSKGITVNNFLWNLDSIDVTKQKPKDEYSKFWATFNSLLEIKQDSLGTLVSLWSIILILNLFLSSLLEPLKRLK